MMNKQFLKAKAKVTFQVSIDDAKEAKEVMVLGDFNNWDTESALTLKKQKSGEFKGTLELDLDQEYQFKYLIDKNKWLNDSEADGFVAGPFGDPNSVLSTKK